MTTQSNLKVENLSIDDVKSIPEFKNISDELAQRLAEAIKTYTEIIYECHAQEALPTHETKVIGLTGKSNRKAA